MKTRYPIYIMSKGRSDMPFTALRLSEMKCPFFFVVENTEVKKYKKLGLGEVLVLPFHDLGQGSIPARNWIWEHAKKNKQARHWVMDDNVSVFYRMNYNRRIPAQTSAIFRCIEDWADRYTNIAFCGPHNKAFAVEVDGGQPALTLNTRIYSMILVNTDLPYRWRGRYNEDTDICIRALKDGWVTCIFKVFLGQKMATWSGAPTDKKKKSFHGGNADNVYNTGDYRKAFVESLQKQHPDVVEMVWKYGRWHHRVNYGPFKKNKPILREGVTPIVGTNEYGMKLVYVGKHAQYSSNKLCPVTPIEEGAE